MEPLLSTADVAHLLDVPVKTLAVWRYKGLGPHGFRVGKYVRYRPEDVRRWLDSLAGGEGAA